METVEQFISPRVLRLVLVVAPVGANPESNDRVVRSGGRMSPMAAEPTATPDDSVMRVSPAVEQGEVL